MAASSGHDPASDPTHDLSDLLHTTDFLKCPGCSQLFSEPLLLPCLHSLCRPCVQNYLKANNDHLDDLACPQCQAKVKGQQDQEPSSNGHVHLNENHFLSSLVELQECQDLKRVKHCDYCKYEKRAVAATARCLECHDNVCGPCADAHRRTKLTRHHKMAPFDQIHMGRFDADIRDCQSIMCAIHDEEALKFLCKKCDILICRECKVSAEHEKHACSDLDEACDRWRGKQAPLVSAARERGVALDKYAQFLESYSRYVIDTSNHVVSEIESHAAKLHALVDQYRDSLVLSIRQAAEKDTKVSAERQTEATTLAKTLESSLHYVDALLQHGKPAEILYSRKLFASRLTALTHAQAQYQTTTLKQYFRPAPLTHNNMANIFGKADSFQQTLNAESVQGICKNNSIELSSALPMPTTSAELVLEFVAKGVSDIKDVWPTGVDTDSTGHVYIVDRENTRVKVFDRLGKLSCEFGNTGTGHLSSPYDITLLSDERLAVTDYHDEEVKLFSKDGRFQGSWRQGFKYPRGVARNNKNQVVVVDVNSHQVTFHNAGTGAIEKTIGGKLTNGCFIFTDPYYVTTTPQNYTIVTDWVSPNVKVFDPEGKPVENYVTYGIGRDRVLQPYGVCCDTYGYIFVADNQNHRVHLIGPDGKFIKFLLTKENGLWHPMALCINQEGHLIVTEALGKVKVFKYM